jgi:copper chaperone NosL
VKTLGAILAVVLLAVVLGVVFWPQERSGPEPIAYGRDVCAQCRMHLSQPGFAGELRDRKGVLSKYDDIGCLLQAMKAQRGEMPEAWVEDHRNGELVPLLTATLVRGSTVATPMGYGIVAFAEPAAAQAFVAERRGEIVALEELIRPSPAAEKPADGEGAAVPP